MLTLCHLSGAFVSIESAWTNECCGKMRSIVIWTSKRDTLLRGSGILLGDTSFRPDSLDSLGCGETAGRCSMLAN